MKKHWRFRTDFIDGDFNSAASASLDSELAGASARASAELVGALNIDSLLAKVLLARGFTDIEEARKFLDTDLEQEWIDPEEIPGMVEVAKALSDAILRKERILIFGDYDVDGICATAVLYKALITLGAEPETFIPQRAYGYGLTSESLSKIESNLPQTLITVDCGISDRESIAALIKKGVQVLVTDHHEPPEQLPDCLCTDPKLDKNCRAHKLAGVGVALKLVSYLGKLHGLNNLHLELLDLAAIATLADRMFLTPENRAIVSTGIKQINERPRVGISALLEVSKINKDEIGSTDLAFNLIPRLNAAGRMKDSKKALDLLLSENSAEAVPQAMELEMLNAKRREEELKLTEKVLMELGVRLSAELENERSIILGGKDWHEGIRGIVASRIANLKLKPTILFTIEEDSNTGVQIARGSGRSVGSINLHELSSKHKELFLTFGGHAQALGISIEADKLGEFKARLEDELSLIPREQFYQPLEIDAALNLEALNVHVVASLARIAPFGEGCSEPVFLLKGARVQNHKAVGANKDHLQITFSDGLNTLESIYFRCPYIEKIQEYEGKVDVVLRLEVNEFNGRKSVKALVEDIDFLDDKFSKLTDEELDEKIKCALIGADAKLHDSQKKVLGLLGGGKSVFTIMATGRGKSLIFNIHAIRTAVRKKKASLFVYPLRALMSDQIYKLQAILGAFNLRAEILSGETSLEGRQRVYELLDRGLVDIVLTTPEFLSIHEQDIFMSNRFSFLVIDEAHHIGTSKAGHRPSYKKLFELTQKHPELQVLATTATADDDVAKEIMRDLKIDELVYDEHIRENLKLNDGRGNASRLEELGAIISSQEKTLVYANSRAATIDIVKDLRKLKPELAMSIAFYNAALDRENRLNIERKFRQGEILTLVATSAFGEGIDIPDIRNLVLYNLPHSLIEFNQMSGRCGRDGQDSIVHLMFNTSDKQTNEAVLNNNAPCRDELIEVFKVLVMYAKSLENSQNAFIASNEDILYAVEKIKEKTTLTLSRIEAALSIFEELKLLKRTESESRQSIKVTVDAKKVELDTSIRYLEGREEVDSFEEFAAWVLNANSGELQRSFTQPILPKL